MINAIKTIADPTPPRRTGTNRNATEMESRPSAATAHATGRRSSLILESFSPNPEQCQRVELHVYCQQQHVYVLCGRRLHKLLLGLWRLFDWCGVGCLAHLPGERKLPGYSDS